MSEDKNKVVSDWKKIVEGSKGELAFCPDKLQDEFDSWCKKRKVLQAENERISKLAIESSVALENLVIKFRYYLEEVGAKDVWQKDIGIETTAIDSDNVKIFSIREKR